MITDNVVGSIGRDTLYALRTLRRDKTFLVVAILSLALGIGGTTAILGALDALFVRPLPVREPGRLITFETLARDGARQFMLTFDDYTRLGRGLGSTVEGLSATTWVDGYGIATDRARDDADDGLARVSVVTGNFFSVIGARAAYGRTFVPDDDRFEGANRVAVVGDAWARRRFGSAPAAVGRHLVLNGTSYEILGVTPPAFTGDWTGWPTDVWLPVSMLTEAAGDIPPAVRVRGSIRAFRVIGRLRSGVSVEQARAVTSSLDRTLEYRFVTGSGVDSTTRLVVENAATGYSPQREIFAGPLATLLAAVVGVLLIACSNVANLLLARAITRRREIAIRMANGASRARVIRQLLTEGGVLGILGGGAGLIFAVWLSRLLADFGRAGPVRSVNFGAASVLIDPQFGWRTLAITTALVVGTTLLFALAPAVRGTGVGLSSMLGSRGPSTSASRGSFSARRLLVAAQVSCSLVLLVGTALFLRSLQHLRAQRFGFDRDRLLQVWTVPSQTKRSGRSLLVLWKTLHDRVAAVHGVTSVSLSTEGLLSGGPAVGPTIHAVGASDDASIHVIATNTVSPGFFAMIGQRLLDGREFDATDTDSAPPRVIVNRMVALRLFHGTNVVGRRVSFAHSTLRPMEIVGVVEDARSAPRDQGPMIYYPPGQNLRRLVRGTAIVVRVTQVGARVRDDIRRAVRAAEPGLPVMRIDTIDEQLDDVIFQDRLIATLVGLFGALALALACVGLYGLLAHMIVNRTNEIGVRLALGATQRSIARMVFNESVALVAIGIGAGVPATLIATRFVSAQLYGVPAGDAASLLSAAAVLALVSIVATLVPALRAASVDPAVALRHE